MRLKTKHALALIVAGAIVGTVAIGLAIAPAAQRPTKAPPVTAPAVTVPVNAAHVTRVARHAFAVLERPVAHTSSVGTPGAVAVSEDGTTIRVGQSANGNVCLVTESATEPSGASCGNPEYLAAHGSAEVSEQVGTPTRLTVLVPNGVETVTATVSDKTEQLTVTNNVATIVTSGVVQHVQYGLPSGATSSWTPPAGPRPGEKVNSD